MICLATESLFASFKHNDPIFSEIRTKGSSHLFYFLSRSLLLCSEWIGHGAHSKYQYWPCCENYTVAVTLHFTVSHTLTTDIILYPHCTPDLTWLIPSIVINKILSDVVKNVKFSSSYIILRLVSKKSGQSCQNFVPRSLVRDII